MADVGRPPLIDDAVLHKLEEAFAIGCSDTEACVYADIGTSTLYNYQNANPGFLERKRLLKERPILKARRAVVKSLDDPNHAKWYLEKKRKDEFGATPLLGEPGTVNILLFHNGDPNTVQLRPPSEAVPVEGAPEPIEVQVFEDPSQGG